MKCLRLLSISSFGILILTAMNGCESFKATAPQILNLESASLSAIYPSLNFLASDSALPSDAGVLNVRDARFGAYGDGVHDDTSAILSAIDYQSRAPSLGAPWNTNFVYLPPGTYLVSDTIQKILTRSSMDANAMGNCQTATCYAAGLVLIGAGPNQTFIKLKDHTPKFSDAANPQAVIFTASSFFDPTNNFNHTIGEGNDGYFNFVESLSIDVGIGNPGAIGIDYLGNNGGAVRSVVINASPGSGKTGLSMLRAATGPALIENVWINGFDVGVDVAGLGYTMNLNRIRLSQQRVYGLQSNQFSLTIENLEIIDSPLPIHTLGSEAMTVLIGANIHTSLASASQVDAFSNSGIAHVRDVTVTGYGQFLNTPVASSPLNGVYAQNTRIGEAKASWSLPHFDPPALNDSSVGTPSSVQAWANVAHFGALGDGDTDSTAAIQAAFASGASTIYFPPGVYRINANVDVPSTVTMIKGFNSVLRPCSYGALACNNQTVMRANDFDQNHGILRLAPTLTPLVIDKLNINNNDLGNQMGIEIYGGSKPVVMRDNFLSGTSVFRLANGATLFMTNYAGGALSVAGPRPVVGRQVDIENQYPAISNSQSPMVIYGMKTEGNITLVDTENGGKTEVLGGLAYIVTLNNNTPPPEFINVDSNSLVSIAEMAYTQGVNYGEAMRSTMAGVVTHFMATDFVPRVQGHTISVLMTAP